MVIGHMSYSDILLLVISAKFQQREHGQSTPAK